MSNFERLREEILLLADGDRSKIYALLNASIRGVGDAKSNKRYVTTSELRNAVESVIEGFSVSNSIPKELIEVFKTQHKASFLANTFKLVFDHNNTLQTLQKKKILYKSDLKSITRPVTLLRRIKRALQVLEEMDKHTVMNVVLTEEGSNEIMLTTKQKVQTMLAHGMKNKDIAGELNVSASYVSNIKRGKR